MKDHSLSVRVQSSPRLSLNPFWDSARQDRSRAFFPGPGAIRGPALTAPSPQRDKGGSMLSVERISSAGEFLAATQGFLGDRELTCGLKLGLSNLLLQEPHVCPSAWFAVIRCHGEIRGCALQTPPRNLVISDLDRDAAVVLANFLAGQGARFPAVHGPALGASAFAEAWTMRACVTSRPELDLRLFSLNRVKLRPSIPGLMRLARPRDE